MKKLLLICLTFCTITCLLFPSKLIAEIASDTFSTIIHISADGTVYEGRIEAPGDFNYFGFNAIVGHTYTISINSFDFSINPEIILYKADEKEEIPIDSLVETKLGVNFFWKANFSGYVLVLVENFNTINVGSYDVSIYITPSLSADPQLNSAPAPATAASSKKGKKGICKNCKSDRDCESGNCGWGMKKTSFGKVPVTKCIPRGVSSYKCKSDSGGGCFISNSTFGEANSDLSFRQ